MADGKSDQNFIYLVGIVKRSIEIQGVKHFNYTNFLKQLLKQLWDLMDYKFEMVPLAIITKVLND